MSNTHKDIAMVGIAYKVASEWRKTGYRYICYGGYWGGVRQAAEEIIDYGDRADDLLRIIREGEADAIEWLDGFDPSYDNSLGRHADTGRLHVFRAVREALEARDLI